MYDRRRMVPGAKGEVESMENDRNAANRRSLPPGLATKIADYRSRVRKRKLFEAGLVAGLGLLVSYLVLFGLDRIDDFPKWLRAIVSFAGFATVAIALPLALWRWVLGTSTVANTARVLARKDDAAGDRVLSAVELTGDSREFDRSPELTAAAIRQVDEDLRDRDFTNALPDTRRRGLLLAGALPLLACLAAFTVCPDAALSSLCRWACPFGEQARYAFAKTEPLADRLYVAKGERFGFAVKLAADARWRPERAEARFENGETFAVEAHDGRFVFEMPGRHKDEDLRIAIGDSKIVVRVLPLDRPEIAALDIDVALPDYLGIAGSKTVDGRSGGLVAVEGATITARARLTRAPARAAENDRDLAVSADGFTAAPRVLKKPEELRFTWSDTFGLDALQPFTLALRPHPDGAPTARLDGLINGAVLLSTDTTSFKVVATDDFGVRRVGIAWTGVADALDNPSPATGERVLAAAEKPDAGGFEAECAFHAPSLGTSPIEPSPSGLMGS